MAPRSAAVNALRREEAKDRILNAAHALFKQHGYDATTMARIAQDAGVSVGLTVYYFRTKQHLVQALADRVLHARMVRAMQRRYTSADDRLAALIDAVLNTAAQEPELIAMHLALLLQPGVTELLADAEHEYESRLVALVPEVLSGRDGGNPERAWLLFRATLMGGAYGMVSPYLPISHVLTRERVFAEYGLDWNLGSPPPNDHPGH